MLVRLKIIFSFAALLETTVLKVEKKVWKKLKKCLEIKKVSLLLPPSSKQRFWKLKKSLKKVEKMFGD